MAHRLFILWLGYKFHSTIRTLSTEKRTRQMSANFCRNAPGPTCVWYVCECVCVIFWLWIEFNGKNAAWNLCTCRKHHELAHTSTFTDNTYYPSTNQWRKKDSERKLEYLYFICMCFSILNVYFFTSLLHMTWAKTKMCDPVFIWLSAFTNSKQMVVFHNKSKWREKPQRAGIFQMRLSIKFRAEFLSKPNRHRL